MLVAVFKAGMAGREHLHRYSEEAAQYAATVKGRLAPGAATALAVAVVEAGGGDDPGGWADAVPGRGLAFPVYLDLGSGRVSCPPAPAELRRLAEQHVAGPSVRSV